MWEIPHFSREKLLNIKLQILLTVVQGRMVEHLSMASLGASSVSDCRSVLWIVYFGRGTKWM